MRSSMRCLMALGVGVKKLNCEGGERNEKKKKVCVA